MVFLAYKHPSENLWIITTRRSTPVPRYKHLFYFTCAILEEVSETVISKFENDHPEVGDTCYSYNGMKLLIQEIF